MYKIIRIHNIKNTLYIRNVNAKYNSDRMLPSINLVATSHFIENESSINHALLICRIRQ